MAFPKSFCCKKSWSLLSGSKIIATTYMIFTAAVLSGLTFIMMNESTFQSLAKMQPSDYLLLGKSLFPQAAYPYIDLSNFESNNLSSTTKTNKSGQNITKISIPTKQQEINHRTNKADIKSYKTKAESGESIDGPNHSTVSSTTKKDIMDKITTTTIIPSTAKMGKVPIVTTTLPATKTTQQSSTAQTSFGTVPHEKGTDAAVNLHSSSIISIVQTISTVGTNSKMDDSQTKQETTLLKPSGEDPLKEEGNTQGPPDLVSYFAMNKKNKTASNGKDARTRTRSKVDKEDSRTKKEETSGKNQPTTSSESGITAPESNSMTTKHSRRGSKIGSRSNKKDEKHEDGSTSKDDERKLEPTKPWKLNQKKINNVTFQTTSSVQTISNKSSSTGNKIVKTDPTAIKIDFTTTSSTNIDNKSTFNVNQTTIIIENQHQSPPSAHMQNSSSVSTKSIKTDDIRKNSTIPANVTITTYSNHILVGSNSFVTSQPNINDKSTNNGNQTTISTYSTAQKRSDDLNTSSYVSTKSTKDESKNSINVTVAKVTTINSTNISKENSSVTISSQNVGSTTLEVPINLLNESLETHKETSQNESKLKVSAKSKKNSRKYKKNPVKGSKTIKKKADGDKDEPTITEPTEPVTDVQQTEPPTIEPSTESTESTAGAEHPRKRSRRPSVPENQSSKLNQKSGANDHENPNAVKESNQDTLTTSFVPTTVSHLPESIQADVSSTTTSKSKKTTKSSKKEKEKHSEQAEEKVLKDENEVTISIEGHTTIGKETRKVTRKGRKEKALGKADIKLSGRPDTDSENEHHTVDESITTANNDHSSTTTDKTPIRTANAHFSTNSNTKKGKNSGKIEEKDLNHHQDNGLKDDKKVASNKESHTTTHSGTEAVDVKGKAKKTTTSKKRHYKLNPSMFNRNTHNKNEADDPVTTTNNDHSSTTTDIPSITSVDTHISKKSKTNSNNKKGGENDAHHHKEDGLNNGKVVAINKESHTTKHSETKGVHGNKSTVKKSTTTKKGRKGIANVNIFGEQHPFEKEDKPADEPVPTTNNDHSVAVTDTPLITITDDAHISAKPEKNLNTKKGKKPIKTGEKSSNNHKGEGFKDGEEVDGNKETHATDHPTVAGGKGTAKKAVTKKTGPRKGKMIITNLGISEGKDDHTENPSRRKRSEHRNSSTHHSTKTNKANSHKESETEVLVNKILISGIALHGFYFGACILLIVGISKRSAGFVAPWVLVEFFRQLGVITIWGSLCYYTVDILNKDAENAKFAIPFCAAILVIIALTFYFWLVVCSLYYEFYGKGHQILPEEKGDPIDSQAISNT